MNYYVEQENRQIKEDGIEFFLDEKRTLWQTAFSHIHPAVEFIYINSGEFRIQIDDECYSAAKGDFLIFRANAVHTIKLTSGLPASYYVLKIAPSLLFQIFECEKQIEYVIPFLQKNPHSLSYIPKGELPKKVLLAWEKLITEWQHFSSDSVIALRIYSAELLLSVIRDLPHVSGEYPILSDVSEKTVSLIYESVSFINLNYAADITATDCAEHIHISYSYFARLFKAVMGKTFKEYLTEVRLSKAQKMLFSSKMSIREISESCGFNSLSYFISQYKNNYGKTPRNARSEYK